MLPRQINEESSCFLKSSEEVGFEPTDPLRGLLFSRQTQSATLPLFRRNDVKILAVRS